MKKSSLNKITYYIIGIITILLSAPCNSQLVNIDYFHGKPSVQYPICNIQSGDLALSVNLNYSPVDIWEEGYVSNSTWLGDGWPYEEGINVLRSNSQRIPANPQAYHPGNFGIGWNLSVGGKITRVIKDLPDEIIGNNQDITPYGGYYHRYGNLYAGDLFDNLSHTIDMKELAGKYDVESDEFSFNFNGISGYFYYHWGKWVVVSESDISIDVQKKYIEGSELGMIFDFFTITTPDGNRYTFGDNDAKEYTTYTSNSFPQCITGWGLTRIESPKGDIITLEYDKEPVYYPLLNQCKTSSSKVDPTLYSSINLDQLTYLSIDSSPSDDEMKSFSKGQTIDKLILRSIVSASCSVTFKKTDCAPFLLPKEGQLYNRVTTGFSKIDNITVTEGKTNFSYDLIYDRTPETLYLKNIKKSVTNDIETFEMPKSEFAYYPSDIFIAPTALKLITYSTGGTSEFVYEQPPISNRCYRLQSHKIRSGTSEKATLYKYHYGTLNLATKGFDEVSGTLNRDGDKKRIFNVGTFWDMGLQKEMTYLTKVENTLYGCELQDEILFPLRPKNEITYNNVCEELLEEGENQNYSRVGIISYLFNGYYDANGKANDEFLIGKLSLAETFDKILNVYKIREINYKPAKDESLSLLSCMNLNFHFTQKDGLQVISTFPKLSESNIKATKYLIDYENIVESSAMYNYKYQYNSSNQVSQKEIVENRYKIITGEDKVEKYDCNTTISYKYVNEFNIPNENGESTPDLQLAEKTIKNLPVEVITKRNGKIIGAKYINYKTLPPIGNDFSSIYKPLSRFYVPYRTYSFQLLSPIDESGYTPVSTDFSTKDSHYPQQPDRTYELYDVYGNVLQYQDKGRPVVSLIYKKINGSWLPIIKGEYCTYDALNNTANTNANDIRKNYAESFITDYTYNDSKKILQQTNPDGKKIFYEYDAWGRLKLIKDTNGNIIEAKSYYNTPIK